MVHSRERDYKTRRAARFSNWTEASSRFPSAETSPTPAEYRNCECYSNAMCLPRAQGYVLGREIVFCLLVRAEHMDRRKTWDTLAGLLAAAVALGSGELAASVLRGSSLLVAVGDVIVDYAPGPLAEATIATLGTNDKPAFLLVVTAASLAIGAVLDPFAGNRPFLGTAAFGLFGLLGAAAVTRDPLTSMWVAALRVGERGFEPQGVRLNLSVAGGGRYGPRI